MKNNKKNLLIVDHSRDFLTSYGNYILEFAKNFSLTLLIEINSDINYPKELTETLIQWKKDEIINNFFYVPESNIGLKYFLFMRTIKKKLISCKFDVIISPDEMQIRSRFLYNIVLPTNCAKLVFWPKITYMLMYNQKLSNLLINTPSNEIANFWQEEAFISKEKKSIKNNFELLKTTIFSKKLSLTSKITNKIKFILFLYNKKLLSFLNRKIYPLFFLGKTIKYEPFDKLTQLGSGLSDAYFFTDPIEVKVHKNLFQHPNIFLVAKPIGSNCECKNSDLLKKDKMLCPLSGWEKFENLEVEILNLFVRDIITIVKKLSINEVILRPHPDFINIYGWSKQLKRELVIKGINTKIEKSSIPINKLACNYKCVSSFASSSLRDIASSCKQIKVIGLKGVSKYYFKDPKFVFGNSEGIEWIEEDGTFNEKIFSKKSFPLNEKIKLPHAVHNFIQGKLNV